MRGWLRSAVLATAIGAAAAQGAQAQDLVPADSAAVKAAAGPWDLVNARGGQRCRVMLNPRNPSGALIAGFPPACRTSFGVLARVRNWGVDQAGRIVLVSAEGAALNRFARGAEDRFASEDGALELVTVAGPYRAAERRATVAAIAPPPPDPRLDAAAGRYTLTRAAGTVGCSVTLETRRSGKAGDFTVTLDPACSDEGLRIFDPIGWRLENDRVFLVAKKGHTVGFSRDRDGRWFKDPSGGRPLLMVKP